MELPNLVGLLNLTSLEMGLFLVEGSILLSFLVILREIRKGMNPAYLRVARNMCLKSPYPNLNQLNHLLKDAEEMSLTLSRNLDEKREMIKKLSDKLEEKIQLLGRLREREETEDFVALGGPYRSNGNGQILKMALDGYGVHDISKRLALPKEEVQLTLDIEKISKN
jgi:hypothetical protein